MEGKGTLVRGFEEVGKNGTGHAFRMRPGVAWALGKVWEVEFLPTSGGTWTRCNGVHYKQGYSVGPLIKYYYL